jgi:hypothetical protein
MNNTHVSTLFAYVDSDVVEVLGARLTDEANLFPLVTSAILFALVMRLEVLLPRLVGL